VDVFLIFRTTSVRTMRPKYGEHVFALCEGHDQSCEVSARSSITFLFLFYVASVTGVTPKLAAMDEFMEYGICILTSSFLARFTLASK
jgi:hypothetical protein